MRMTFPGESAEYPLGGVARIAEANEPRSHASGARQAHAIRRKSPTSRSRNRQKFPTRPTPPGAALSATLA